MHFPGFMNTNLSLRLKKKERKRKKLGERVIDAGG
jgi:hypothetical protein